MKYFSVLFFAGVIMGCAKGQIDILDANEKVVGHCSANIYWHWHGAQDTVDYLLHVCAQEQVKKGYELSDNSILENEFRLPEPPQDSIWNKRTALRELKSENISEKEYGYIRAAIEYEYWVTQALAKEHLEAGSIEKAEYDRIMSEAKFKLRGQ